MRFGSLIHRVASGVVLVAISTLAGCASLEGGLDSSALGDSAASMLKAVDLFEKGRLPGAPSLEAFLSTYEPFELIDGHFANPGIPASASRDSGAPPEPQPSSIASSDPAYPPKAWLLSGKDLRQERFTIPSISALRGGVRDDAVFYLYYRGRLSGKRAILWIPGYGVSDFAFGFIRKFFAAELDHNYAILFYTLPGHLERIPKGEKTGEALLSADPAVNLQTVSIVMGELEAGMKRLRERGISGFDGWGGSMGAAFLMLLAEQETFGHLVLMIPVVDWNSILDSPPMKPVRERLSSAGYPDELLRSAYDAVSPASRRGKILAGRVLIQYARFDRLTPESLTLDFARSRAFRAIGYDDSHSTILLDPKVAEDYRKFLDEP